MSDGMNRAVYPAALDAMAATQASGGLPGWFLPNVVTSVVKSERSWRICYSVFRAWELEEGESWELQPDGSRMLVREDPVMGKMVAIHCDRPESERMVLFAVEVGLETMVAVVEKSTELAGIDTREIHLATTKEMRWPG